MNEQGIGIGIKADADIVRGAQIPQALALKNTYEIECFDKDGNLKWTDIIHNAYMNEGLDDVLDKYYKGSTYTAAHYVGLLVGAVSPITFGAADTMASRSGWTEDQNYSEGTREVLTMGTVASQSVDNSASKASYSMNASTTISGMLITTNNTKGGTTGTLVAAGLFTGGDKVLDNGDTLNVTVTATSASA